MNKQESDNSYHILKGRPVQYRSEKNEGQVLLECGGVRFWAIVNVRVISVISNDTLLYAVYEDYRHPMTEKLEKAQLPFGFSKIQKQPKGLALDYVKSNAVNIDKMTLQLNDSTTYTPLNEIMASLVKRAQRSNDACMYFFGSRFVATKDAIKRKNPFHLINNEGIESILLNKQENSESNSYTDWQDGALLVHFPSNNTWSALFIAYKSEMDRLKDTQCITDTDKIIQNIKIVAVDTKKTNSSIDKIYIFNNSNENMHLDNWYIEDESSNRATINNLQLHPKTVGVIEKTQYLKLNKKNGFLILYNNNGIKIDGILYRNDEVQSNLSLFDN